MRRDAENASSSIAIPKWRRHSSSGKAGVSILVLDAVRRYLEYEREELTVLAGDSAEAGGSVGEKVE